MNKKKINQDRPVTLSAIVLMEMVIEEVLKEIKTEIRALSSFNKKRGTLKMKLGKAEDSQNTKVSLQFARKKGYNLSYEIAADQKDVGLFLENRLRQFSLITTYLGYSFDVEVYWMKKTSIIGDIVIKITKEVQRS